MGYNICIYYRVSTELQSIASQKVTNEEWIKRGDHNVVKVYEESESALKSRPIFRKMLNEIEEEVINVDGILIFDFDRMIRDPADYLRFTSVMISTGKLLFEPDGRVRDFSRDEEYMVGGIMSYIKHKEAKDINKRHRAGIKAFKDKNGYWGRYPINITVKKLEPFLTVEKDGRKYFGMNKKLVAGALGCSTAILNRELRKLGYDYLVGSEPEQLKNKRGRRPKKKKRTEDD